VQEQELSKQKPVIYSLGHVSERNVEQTNLRCEVHFSGSCAQL